MRRDRRTARAMWQALADGQFDRGSLLWLANVAGDILKADDAPDNRRAGQMLHAVQLTGRFDPQRQIIRNIVGSVDHTCALIERGTRWAAGRALGRGEQSAMRREAVAAALALQESDETIDARIRRALAD